MSIHPHVDVPDGWCPKAFWAEKMSYAIADPVWFAGTVAFAESMKQKTIAGTSKKSEEVMIYSARAIAGLRDRIAANKTKVDDLAILTITSLMSMDVSLPRSPCNSSHHYLRLFVEKSSHGKLISMALIESLLCVEVLTH